MALDTEKSSTQLSTSTPTSTRPAALSAGQIPAGLAGPKPRRRVPWSVTIAGILVVGIGAAIFGVGQMSQQRTNEELLKLTVPAKVVDLTQRLRVSGQAQPVRQVNISPRESGRLVELFVDQGDRVQQGQLLARMDYGNLSGGLVQAEGRVTELQAKLDEQKVGERSQTIAAAEAKVKAAQSRVDIARTEVVRSQALATAQARADAAQAKVNLARAEAKRFESLAAEGASSRTQVETKLAERDQAEADLRVAEAEVANARTELQSKNATRDQALADLQAAQQDLSRLRAGSRPEEMRQTEAQIRQAQGQLQQQQAKIRETEIRAPFAGIVTQRFATVGAIVTPTTTASDATAATSSSILSLAQGIEVRADVPEAQIAQVRVGQTVEIRAVSSPNQVIQGRVRRIAPATVVVREVTIFRVTIDPQTDGEQLRAGMNTSVDFVGKQQPKALTVPAVALIYQDNKEGVLVWDAQKQQAVYRQVKTGISQSGTTEILEGLQAGDSVFTSLPPGKTLKDFTNQSTDPSSSRG